MTLVFLFVVILLSAANGANDNFKGMATLWGSDTLSYRRALLLANAATFAGGCVALVFGAALLKTFSGKGIVAPETLANNEFALAFSIGAAATVGLATLLRYPISTTHAIVGALAGSAFALDGSASVFSSLFGKAFVPLLFSPLLAMGLTYVLWQTGLLWQASRWTASVPVALAAGPQRNVSIPFSGQATSQLEDKGHIASGLTVCFARGVNDTPKIASILLLSQSLALSKQEIVVLIAFFMVVGGFFFSANIARSAQQENHRHVAAPRTGRQCGHRRACALCFQAWLGCFHHSCVGGQSVRHWRAQWQSTLAQGGRDRIGLGRHTALCVLGGFCHRSSSLGILEKEIV